MAGEPRLGGGQRQRRARLRPGADRRLAGAPVETRELESAPALAPLYAKATFGALPIPGGSDGPPDHGYALEAAAIDVEALADYARVCGFTLRETLPPTYPHLLGFPLAMKLMTERTFPFALLGMVHIANRIEQSTPIGVAARPRLRVW